MSVHPAPVADIRTDFSLLIDGTAASAGSTLEVINPATGQVFARCPAAGREELDRAVDGARRAFPMWRDTSYDERAQRIRDFGQSLNVRISCRFRVHLTQFFHSSRFHLFAYAVMFFGTLRSRT